MPRYLAFLRGINLGKRRIKMDALRAAFETLEFANVSTFIASGNVLFDSPARDDAKLARQIERHLAATLGYAVDTFVRTREEVAALAASQPFPASEMSAETHTITCAFLRAPLPEAQAKGLVACRTARDEFVVAGREFYWLCRGKNTDSLAWDSPAWRALRLPTATMRNLTTLRKLVALFASD